MGFVFNQNQPYDRFAPVTTDSSPEPNANVVEQTAKNPEEDPSWWESAVKGTDNLFSGSRKSGRFNSLFDRPLYYPEDLQYSTEITNWLEFRIFTIKNGGLEQAVSKISNRLSGLGEELSDVGVGAVGAYTNQVYDTSETRKELTAIRQERAKFIDGKRTLPTDQEVYAAQITKGDTLLKDSRELVGDSVHLYLPGGLQFDDKIKYEEVGFGAMKALTSDLNTIGALGSLRVLQKLGAGVDKVASILGAGDANTTKALEKQLGLVVNPRVEQHFQGIETRTISFAFDFAPRSKEEAKMVGDIIKVFRFHAYPEVSQNKAFFQFPSEFEINAKSYDPRTGRTSKTPFIPKMNRCVLTGIKTNYTPDEVYYSFSDGTPIRITMSLDFTEADYITRQHIVEGY